MSVLADIMIIHQLRETIFMRSLHLISSKVFHTSMDSKKALSLRTEPYALFCTYKPYYHINSSRPKEYRPHDIYLCLLLEAEVISCVNACHYTDDSEQRHHYHNGEKSGTEEAECYSCKNRINAVIPAILNTLFMSSCA